MPCIAGHIGALHRVMHVLRRHHKIAPALCNVSLRVVWLRNALQRTGSTSIPVIISSLFTSGAQLGDAVRTSALLGRARCSIG